MKSNNDIIREINKQVQTLTSEEKVNIYRILEYHECEPMAAAEKISELLGVDYSAIFELL